MTRKTISITGMSCDHCVTHVRKALEGLDGVSGADVSLDAGEAIVTTSEQVSDEAITAAVKAAGYEATVA